MSVIQSYEHVEKFFRGKALLVDGESHGNIVKDVSPHDHLYQVGGPVKDTDRTLQVYYSTVILFLHPLHIRKRIIDTNYARPKWNGHVARMIYFQGNCARHRQDAAKELASAIGIDFPLGKCSVNHKRAASILTDKSFPAISLNGHNDNWKLFENNKYCLVMENAKIEGYITEKIINAFLGGCLPIYWGTEEIFQVFNRKSFLFFKRE